MASALILVLHVAIERIHKRFRGAAPVNSQPTSTPTGIVSDVKHHISTHGGPVIFTYKFARLVGCLAMLGFSIATFILDEPDIFATVTGKWGKKHKKHRKKEQQELSEKEWLHFTLVLTFVRVFKLSYSRCGDLTRHLGLCLVIIHFLRYPRTQGQQARLDSPRYHIVGSDGGLCLPRYLAIDDFHVISIRPGRRMALVGESWNYHSDCILCAIDDADSIRPL